MSIYVQLGEQNSEEGVKGDPSKAKPRQDPPRKRVKVKDSIRSLMRDVKSAFNKRPALIQAAAVLGAPVLLPYAVLMNF